MASPGSIPVASAAVGADSFHRVGLLLASDLASSLRICIEPVQLVNWDANGQLVADLGICHAVISRKKV